MTISPPTMNTHATTPSSPHAPIAAAQQTTITINTLDSKVVVKLATDRGHAIRAERVLLLKPDGKTAERTTDDAGVAVFDALPFAPLTPVYLALPDVLERWSAIGSHELFLHTGPDHTRRLSEHDANADRGELEEFRTLHKDELDQLEKNDVPGADSSALAVVNESARDQRGYRWNDRTKYLVRTSAATAENDRVQWEITLDRLNTAEKFAHFHEVWESHNAWYTAGRMNYDPDRHRWWGQGGAVCNQLANIFLGYWYNHNNAYTGGATATSFLKQMENDSSRDRTSGTYAFRGFRDVLQAPLAAPALPENPDANVPTSRHRGRVYRDGSRGNFDYVRLRSADLVQNNGRYSFAHAWQRQLADFNVYSYATRKNNTLVFDHHGGVLIRDPQDGWRTWAADGWKSASGRYSETPITYKPPTQLENAAQNRELHLLVWPMKTLRPGGYAPLPVDAEDEGTYRPDPEMGELNAAASPQSAIHPDFCHSLPRFFYWQTEPNE